MIASLACIASRRKRSGEFSGEVLFYTKEEDDDSSGAVSDEAAGEFSPAEFSSSSGEPLSAHDIARLVASTVNATLEARDKRVRAEQPQPGAIDMLREMEEMAERRANRDRERREEIRAEISAMLPRDNPSPPLSAEQQLRLAVVEKTGVLPMMFREMREALGTAQRVAEPQGLGSQIFDFVKEIVPYVGPVVGPALGAKLVAMLGRMDEGALANAAAAAVAAQSTPSPTDSTSDATAPQGAAPDQSPLSLDDVLGYIKQDIIANNDPKECVDAVVQLLVEQPQLMPAIGGLLSKENQELLAILSQATNANLAIVANAGKFVDGLRDGVRSRLQVQPSATGNGHKPEPAAAAATGKTGGKTGKAV